MKWMVIAAVMTAPLSAEAEMLSGNKLHEACSQRDVSNAFEMFCSGYIVGALEGIQYGALLPDINSGRFTKEEILERAEKNISFCIPDGATNGQFVEIVTKHLLNYPEVRHLQAFLLIDIALTEAFPCDGR